MTGDRDHSKAKAAMTPQAFHRLLESHGGDPARWPAEKRNDAEALLAISSEARSALADAQRLDALILAAAPAPAKPSAALMGRVMADAAWLAGGNGAFDWRALLRPRPAFAGAMALSLGLALGIFAVPVYDNNLTTDDYLSLAFASPAQDYFDIEDGWENGL
jgi:hypothetical protein